MCSPTHPARLDPAPIIDAIRRDRRPLHVIHIPDRSWDSLRRYLDLQGADFVAVRLDEFARLSYCQRPISTAHVAVVAGRGLSWDGDCREVDQPEALRVAQLWLRHRWRSEVTVSSG